MEFSLSEEHEMIQKAAGDFAQSELKPGVIERDENQKFPAEQIKKLGELGFMRMMVDPIYGGSGMDAISYVLVMEEISKIDASASVVPNRSSSENGARGPLTCASESFDMAPTVLRPPPSNGSTAALSSSFSE